MSTNINNSQIATSTSNNDSNIAIRSQSNATDKDNKEVSSSASRKKANGKSKPNQKVKHNKEYNNLNDDFSQKIETQIKHGKKFNGSNRKNQISINHLLEFQSYKDLEEYQNRHAKPRRRNSNNMAKSTGYGNGKSRDYYYSKVHLKGMSFINVNYKFVVDYRRDYKAQKMDPNLPVDINDILRIIVPKGNSCPICLSDEPVAPRMITSCGHILCLSCLLSLLESEVPIYKKREAPAIVEKYRDCPLCFSVIRSNEIKPVLVNNIDERFEVPKINDEVVLTLMNRPQERILALPNCFNEYHDVVDNFPWVNQLNPDFGQYLRIFKGDLKYILDMYESEKKNILDLYQEEKLLYNDDGKFAKIATANIDNDIEKWKSYYKDEEPSCPRLSEDHHPKIKEMDSSNSYFFYQTGFNASSTYVLSPLDVKVLKTAYKDYTNLPSSLIAKIENIRYEELTPESSITKYKYLSHLPFGTSIGFLECNWYQNEYINHETWEMFKHDLSKRTKYSTKKLRKEEKDKTRAMNEEEARTRNFFERENNGQNTSDPYETQVEYGNFGSLSIIDHRELPALSSEAAGSSNNEIMSDSSTGEYQTTIWGTKIPKAEAANDDSDGDWDAEEMIRRAKEEIERQENGNGKGKGKQKKKKKKLVLLSSNSTWQV